MNNISQAQKQTQPVEIYFLNLKNTGLEVESRVLVLEAGIDSCRGRRSKDWSVVVESS